MFQKKDYIYSEAMGVCRVEDVTNLSSKKGNAVSYYVLRSVYQKDKVAYIPAEKHAVVLRCLISQEEARRLQDAYCQEHPDFQQEQTELKRFADLELQYKMADMLSEEKRLEIYRLGEIEFVLNHQTDSSKENKKKPFTKKSAVL